MKNNKWIFAILAFVIVACTLIYIGSIVTEYTASYPGHELSLFGALLVSYFPTTMSLIAVLYFVKYILERSVNQNAAWQIINIARSFIGIVMTVFYPFKSLVPQYATISLIVGGIIAALFAAELVMWLVSLGKKKA